MIIRITPPGAPRSPRATASLAGLSLVEVPTIQAKGTDKRDREIACSLAHAGAIRAFLETSAPFAAVLEDDAILAENLEWLSFTDFDLFLPFRHSREEFPPVATIRRGVLPIFGTYAYLCSRAFAERYLPRLLAGEIADHAHHEAARGLRTGSFEGNVVEHDALAPSAICEERRLYHLQRARERASLTRPPGA